MLFAFRQKQKTENKRKGCEDDKKQHKYSHIAHTRDKIFPSRRAATTKSSEKKMKIMKIGQS
jgi:hypothetical protein